MASIKATARNQLFYIPDEGEPQILLDCSLPLANRSRLPLFPGRNDPRPSMLQLVAGYMEQCRQDPACEHHQLGYSILLCLLANELQHIGGPIHVLEYGCGDGAFSPFPASLLGAFDPKSVLYCLSDFFSPDWPKRMAQVSLGPKAAVKYLVSRYGDSGLRPSFFDAVLLNGSSFFRDPQALLGEALELLTDDGVLLCYTDDDPLTDSLLALCFDAPVRFRLDDRQQITVVRKAHLSWPLPTPGDKSARIDRLLEEAQAWLEAGTDAAQGAALDRQLDLAADETVLLDDRRRKQQLLDVREALLDRLSDTADK